MNFTSEIKRDLCRHMPAGRTAGLALFRAALDTSGSRSYSRVGVRGGFSFTSENEEVAAALISLADRLFGVNMTLSEAVTDPKHGRDKLTFSYHGPAAGEISELLEEYGPAALEGEPEAQAYLRGAFLGSGSCVLPRTAGRGYHLEFVFREEPDADDFLELSDRLQLIAGKVPRGETYVVYCKSREGIGDFLSVMGAEGALSTFERVSLEREKNNAENRRENCTAGNADRAATASVRQTLVIGELLKNGILPTLPVPLREAAEGRLSHPELSLSELADLLGVSKSCLNHRIRKLCELAKGTT